MTISYKLSLYHSRDWIWMKYSDKFTFNYLIQPNCPSKFDNDLVTHELSKVKKEITSIRYAFSEKLVIAALISTRKFIIQPLKERRLTFLIKLAHWKQLPRANIAARLYSANDSHSVCRWRLFTSHCNHRSKNKDPTRDFCKIAPVRTWIESAECQNKISLLRRSHA